MQNNYGNISMDGNAVLQAGEDFVKTEPDKKTVDTEITYAGFWARAAAYVIDSVVVFAALLVVRLVMFLVMKVLSGTVLGGNLVFQYDLKDIVLYVLKVLYFILFTYYIGATPGKRAMNLKVVSEDPEGRLSLFTVVYRETIGRFLSSVIAGVGYLMIGIDKEKRGLHDILCDTRVVYAKKVKVYETKVVIPIQTPVYHAQAAQEQPQPEYTVQPAGPQPESPALRPSEEPQPESPAPQPSIGPQPESSALQPSAEPQPKSLALQPSEEPQPESPALQPSEEPQMDEAQEMQRPETDQHKTAMPWDAPVD